MKISLRDIFLTRTQDGNKVLTYEMTTINQLSDNVEEDVDPKKLIVTRYTVIDSEMGDLELISFKTMSTLS